MWLQENKGRNKSFHPAALLMCPVKKRSWVLIHCRTFPCLACFGFLSGHCGLCRGDTQPPGILHGKGALSHEKRGRFSPPLVFDFSIDAPGKPRPLCKTSLSASRCRDPSLNSPAGSEIQLTCSGKCTNSIRGPLSRSPTLSEYVTHSA